MIIGTGIDIIEISRIAAFVNRQPRFAQRILNEKEMIRYRTLQGRRQVEFLAGRFAAKEAYAKAIGTGIGIELSWHDITVVPDEKGKPVISSHYPYHTHLSISHSKEFAAATVIIESLSS
ncbi:holo-ACP synthase [Fictibacillus iocasae]|uniref:Holo-[acyl-carrier-protein] synthase n=1 Tax=Fictibacillus iocasae TaxID=2715437 RepID=A0ABW2NUT7_9BACL